MRGGYPRGSVPRGSVLLLGIFGSTDALGLVSVSIPWTVNGVTFSRAVDGVTVAQTLCSTSIKHKVQ